MNTIDIATPLVKASEGFRSLLYDDKTDAVIEPGTFVKGNPTVGYGFALAKQGLSVTEATFLLQNRLAVAFAAAQHAVGAALWAKLDPIRQAALVDMAYTLGGAGLMEFHQMIAALGAGDWNNASLEVRASLWARNEAPSRADRDAQILYAGVLP